MNNIMQKITAVAANTTISNVLQGERFERGPHVIGIGALMCCGSAAGLTAELNVGGVSITPPTSVNTQNRYPIVPDDLLAANWEVPKGELIQLTVVNTTGGALNFFWRVEIEEAEYE